MRVLTSLRRTLVPGASLLAIFLFLPNFSHAQFSVYPASSQPQQVAPAPPVPPPPVARPVILLDAAHGGPDLGAHFSDGQWEKDATLAFGVKLRSLLAARGFQVITTRESDTAVDAARRAEIANRVHARACLSLHATETGSGVHLFDSSLAPASGSRFVAWKTAQSAWVERSLALTGELNSALQHGGFPVTLARAALPGIDSMACPAVAIEVAPLRDASQKIETPATDADYQSRVAEAIAAALVVWRQEAP